LSSSIESAKSQHNIEKQIREFDPATVSFVTNANGGRPAGGGPADQFIASKGWQQIDARRSYPMTFTHTEQRDPRRLLLAREGKRQVVEPWALSDADRLEQSGWLEHRCSSKGSPGSGRRARRRGWKWTALTQSVEGREN